MFNSLPNDKILDVTKLKAFADDKMKVTEKMEFVLKVLENTCIVEKGENSGDRAFSPFPTIFSKGLILKGY